MKVDDCCSRRRHTIIGGAVVGAAVAGTNVGQAQAMVAPGRGRQGGAVPGPGQAWHRVPRHVAVQLDGVPLLDLEVTAGGHGPD